MGNYEFLGIVFVFYLKMTEGIIFVWFIITGEVTILGKSIFAGTPVEITMITKAYRLFEQVKQVKNKVYVVLHSKINVQATYYISSNISAGRLMLEKPL